MHTHTCTAYINWNDTWTITDRNVYETYLIQTQRSGPHTHKPGNKILCFQCLWNLSECERKRLPFVINTENIRGTHFWNSSRALCCEHCHIKPLHKCTSASNRRWQVASYQGTPLRFSLSAWNEYILNKVTALLHREPLKSFLNVSGGVHKQHGYCSVLEITIGPGIRMPIEQ